MFTGTCDARYEQRITLHINGKITIHNFDQFYDLYISLPYKNINKLFQDESRVNDNDVSGKIHEA